MSRLPLTLSLLVLLCAAGWSAPLTYPVAPHDATVDTYGTVKVPDPYRPLEDVDSPATRAWVQAETKLTQSFLSVLPWRTDVHQDLERLWNYDKELPPIKQGGRYFFERFNGLVAQPVLMVQDGPKALPRVLLDPNTLSKDGTSSLAEYSFTNDGKRMAWGQSDKGSDWQTWRVRDVESGLDLPDELHWLKFTTASWTADGTGFYYDRYDAPKPGQERLETNKVQHIYFHRLGDAQDKDVLVYDRPDHPDWFLGTQVTEDGHYLIISVSSGTDPRAGLSFLDLTQADAKVQELLPPGQAIYSFLDNDDGLFYVQTDADAPRGRIVLIDSRHPDKAGWREVVPQTEDSLQGTNLMLDHWICEYLHDACAKVVLYGKDGSHPQVLKLPGLGTVSGFGGRRDVDETFFRYTSYISPSTVYRLDMKTLETSVFFKPDVAFDANQFEARQVFYHSKDGTRIPMFLAARKGVLEKGHAPTLLYGYGGFDISITPAFSIPTLVWMQHGGVYAVANIRGGNEYGEEWHKAGTLANKQNVFDDFIAAAQYLVHQKITTRSQLAINGASNGGLLIGAVEVQRPDLFGACIPAVGVLDMLRFNKFTIGWAWTAEYGSPEDPKMFPVLRRYSPLQNIRKGVHYPPTLIMTSDHDDRVVPGHSFKFAAALQAAQAGPAPILIRIQTSAGHGAGKPTAKQIDEAADWISFLIKVLHMRTR